MMRSLLHKIKRGIEDMCYIWMREMRRTVSDEGVLIFMILVPLLYPLLYSWIYTNEVVREVPVAVVDLSNSHVSREFIRDVDATPDINTAYFCDNMEEAERLVAEQKVKGILYFPEDFSVLLNRGEQAHVGVYCDMSLMLTYKAIYTSTLAVATHLNSGIQVSQGGGFTNRDDELAVEPLRIHEVSIFNATGGYGNALIPAVLILLIQQTLLLGIGLSAGTAREKNANRELVPVNERYAGVFRIVLGKALCYFMLYAVMGSYLLLVVPKLFGFTSLVTAETVFGLLIPFTLACIFFSMTLSCLVRYRENVMLLVVFTSVPFLFLTGVSWPQNNIPAFWESVSYILPSTFGVRGFLRINGMGATLADIEPEFQALWLQVACYFFLACGVYRHQIKMARTNAGLPAEAEE